MRARPTSQVAREGIEAFLRQIDGWRDRQLCALDELLHIRDELARSFGLEVIRSGSEHAAAYPYMLIEDGDTRPLSLDDARQLRANPTGDFVLDATTWELLVGLRVQQGPANEWVRGSLLPSHGRLLQIGMSRPGAAFGHRDLARVFGLDARVSARSLKEYICRLRRQLTDLGVVNTVIESVPVAVSYSTSRRGYRLNPRWRYVVITPANPGDVNASDNG